MMESYMHVYRIILMVVLQGWFPGSYSKKSAFTLPKSIRALRGSCVEIPFSCPRNYRNFNLVWYKEIELQFDYKIFNHRDSSDVNEHYRGRTSLVGNEPNSCSLRINDVQETGTFYPYINSKKSQTVNVQVSDVPNEPSIQKPSILTEGGSVSISCSVEHTCPSSPPTLQWNKAGYNITYNQMRLKDGVWKATTVMEYLPSYQDHGTELICDAIHPNGLKSKTRWVTLNIRYAPKRVAVLFGGERERKEGDEVSLSCTSEANPAANDFIWYNNMRDETVELREEHGQNINVTLGWDREKFSCTARNPLGTGNSRVYELQVLYKAKNVTIKGKEEMKEGEILELECHFSDYNTIKYNYSYNWYLNGNPVNGKTGRILQIINITKSKSGNYSCNVQNRAGHSYSPLFSVTVMAVISAQTGEELPMGIILGGVAGAALLILLVLSLYLFLRKTQKLEAPEGRRVETNNQEHLSNDGQENYYCNFSAIAGPSRNSTVGTQLSEMELEDLYSKPKEPNEVEYILVNHVPSNGAAQQQNPVEETEYSIVNC
ncbi:sialoadhesin-like [Xenopus laevis]|uniref:Sialoadhesin-like n=1 Tax=Xenopus laevis TaxID=8355 RepID=A0A8J1LG19_XENLA|nr:sialoadhesin-like [Xenopus laevis]XP_041427645.1 sialoadhesin-like [Xenopus laevis]